MVTLILSVWTVAEFFLGVVRLAVLHVVGWFVYLLGLAFLFCSGGFRMLTLYGFFTDVFVDFS